MKLDRIIPLCTFRSRVFSSLSATNNSIRFVRVVLMPITFFPVCILVTTSLLLFRGLFV